MGRIVKAVPKKTANMLSIGAPTVKDLIGENLEDFNVREYTEVYRTDVDGRKVESLGCFEDDEVAEVFAANQTDAAWHKTQKVVLLTDGKVAFLLGDFVKLVDSKKALSDAREAALAKLSSAERNLIHR